MLSREENKKELWYPEEEICKKRKDLPGWVRQQRKIAAKASKENHGLYFTLDMLMVPFKVTKAVKGLDTDKGDQDRQLKDWFKRNRGTGRRKLSAKQRDHKRKSVALARQGKTKAQHILDQILAPDGAGDCFSENQPNDNQFYQNMEVK